MMVGLEVMHRNGMLKDDWNVRRSGKDVRLTYSPLKKGVASPFALDVAGDIAC